jgi:hypothetical protein
MTAITSSDFRQFKCWDDMEPFGGRVVVYKINANQRNESEVYSEGGEHFAFIEKPNKSDVERLHLYPFLIFPLMKPTRDPFRDLCFQQIMPHALRLATKEEAGSITKAISEGRASFYGRYCDKEAGCSVLIGHVKLLEPGKS